MWWCQHEHRIALALSGRGRDGNPRHRGANRPVQRGLADRLGGVITIGMDEHSTGSPFGALSVCPGPARPGRPGARSVLTRSSSSPSAAGWISSRFSFPSGPASRSNAAMTTCWRPVALHVLGVDLELKVPRQPPSEALGVCVCVYHFVALLALGAGRRSPGADIDTRPSQRQARQAVALAAWLPSIRDAFSALASPTRARSRCR